MKELVAYERNEDEIAEILGCDWILYQNLKDLEDSVREAGECSGNVFPQGGISEVVLLSYLLSPFTLTKHDPFTML